MATAVATAMPMALATAMATALAAALTALATALARPIGCRQASEAVHLQGEHNPRYVYFVLLAGTIGTPASPRPDHWKQHWARQRP